MVSRPEAGPAALGENATCALVDWLGPSVVPATGSPVAENGAEGKVAAPMVRGCPPLLTRERLRVDELPLFTSPKARDAGLTDSCAGRAPAPVSCTVRSPPSPLLLRIH